MQQATLARAVMLEGVGLHRGVHTRLRILPAPADHGIVFRRVDLPAGANRIPALWSHVVDTRLNTTIGTGQGGAVVSTVEHLMAALAGVGIHNALIEIDGPEVPILDGSAAPFVDALLEAGVAPLGAPLEVIEITAPVAVRRGEALARLEPAAAFEIDYVIAFDEPAIGRQQKRLRLANGAFCDELADSRTFCRLADVEVMKANGLALGGSLENAIVVDGARVLNEEGLRHTDEYVRHKMLDALGDLALAGAPIRGRYLARRAGHAVTNALLRRLFADPASYRRRPAMPGDACWMPGPVGANAARLAG